MEEEKEERSNQASSAAVGSLTVWSPAFKMSHPIPVEHSHEQGDVSPAIHWSGVPKNTKCMALLCEDPDAPTPEPFVHWIMINIPPHTSGIDQSGLPKGVSHEFEPQDVPGAWQGENDFGEVGYGGPAPPPGHGVHHYHFQVYALDRKLPAKKDLNKKKLLQSLNGRILAQSEVVGTFER